MTRKACARLPWRIVEVQSCVVPYAVACCFVLLYFCDGDGRDYIHTTVRSLRTDQRVGPRWDRWKTRLQYYIDARGITVDNRKRALLLHLAGPSIQDIFATLSDTGTSYMKALTALNTYFTPQKSLQFERHTFRQAHQAPNESISQYVTRLRQLGEHCDFDKYSLDEAIKDQLIEHCHSHTLRRRLLREKSTVSLSSLIDIARSMESANFQAANIENASSQENSEFAHNTNPQ